MKRGKLAKIIVMVLCITLAFGSVSVSAGWNGSDGGSTRTSVDHIDVKSAVAVTEDEDGSLDTDTDVSTITYVGYTTDSALASYTDVFSGSRTMGTDETRFTGLSVNVSGYVAVKIEGTFTDGTSFSVVFDTNSTYPDNTYYPASATTAYKLGTYYGISTTTINGVQYYDISGKNVIEVAKILCDGSSVTKGNFTTISGIDFALNYETIKQYSLNIEKEVSTTLYSDGMDYTSDDIDWEDSASFTDLSEDTDTVEVLFKVTVSGTKGTDISSLTDYMDGVDNENITLISSTTPTTLPEQSTSTSYSELTFYYVVEIPVTSVETTFTNEAYIGTSFEDAIAKDTADVTVNKIQTTDITVTKDWTNVEDEVIPSEVKVVLTIDGNADYNYTAVLNADNNWTYTWEDIEYENGTEFSALETEIDGEDVSDSDYEFTVTGSASNIQVPNYENVNTTTATISNATTQNIEWYDYLTNYSISYSDEKIAVVSDGDTFLIWTKDALTSEEQDIVIDAINEVGEISISSSDSVSFYSGTSGTYTYYVKTYGNHYETRNVTFTYSSMNQKINISFSNKSDWSYIYKADYSIEKTTTSVLTGYTTTTSATIDSVSFNDSYEPCNNLTVSLGDDPLILVKKGNTFYVWTDIELTSEQEKQLIEAIYTSGVASDFKEDTVPIFISGTGSNIDDYDISVTSTNGIFSVLFAEKSSWSLIYGGTVNYNRSIVVSNTLINTTTEVSGTKTWADWTDIVDTDDQPNTDDVNLTLYQTIDYGGDIGEVKTEVSYTTDQLVWSNTDSGTWTYEISGLSKYADTDNDGKYDTEIVYTVEESADGYTTVTDDTGFDFTNYLTYTSLSGTKTWINWSDVVGTDDQPYTDDVTLTLYQTVNGTTTEVDYTTDQLTWEDTETGTWTYTFTDLPKYADTDNDGNVDTEIVYTVEESADGYITKVDDTGLNFTNYPETGSLKIIKEIDNEAIMNVANGDAIFTFKIVSEDGDVYYATINYDVDADVNYAILEDLPVGKYTVTELSTLRYADNENSYTVEVTGYGDVPTATFENVLVKTGWNSHTDVVINHFNVEDGTVTSVSTTEKTYTTN